MVCFRNLMMSVFCLAILAVGFSPDKALAVNEYQADGFIYELSKGEATITGYTELASGTLVIPSEIEGFPVVAIGDSAFEGSGLIRGLTISSGVKSIGDRAFAGCSEFQFLTTPDSVMEIGDAAFYGCSKILTANIKGPISYLGEEAFAGCSSLRSISINENASITSVKDRTFYDCSSLTKIILPSTVTFLGEDCFTGMAWPSVVYVPTMGQYALFDDGEEWPSKTKPMIEYYHPDLKDRRVSVAVGQFRAIGCTNSTYSEEHDWTVQQSGYAWWYAGSEAPTCIIKGQKEKTGLSAVHLYESGSNDYSAGWTINVRKSFSNIEIKEIDTVYDGKSHEIAVTTQYGDKVYFFDERGKEIENSFTDVCDNLEVTVVIDRYGAMECFKTKVNVAVRVTDEDGDGILEDEEGNRYISDQDGDTKVEPDSSGNCVFVGTKSGKIYLVVEDGSIKDAFDNGDGTYIVDGYAYVPDQDKDGRAEPDIDCDGVFVGTKNGKEYLVATDGLIKEKFITVETPKAAHGLVYSGLEQVGVPAGEGYTLSGVAKATDAGSYSTTATLLEGFEWANGSTEPVTIGWSISKAECDMSGVSFADAAATYDGGVHSIYVSGELPEGLSVSYAGNDRSDAGSYEVVATFSADANHVAPAPMAAKLTVEPASISSVDGLSVGSQSYTGSAVEPKLELSFNGGPLAEGVDYAVSFADNVAVGTATATVTGKGNFQGEVVVEFEIAREVVLVAKPKAATGLVYDGSELTGVPAGEGYTLSGVASATNAGSYVATAALSDGYVWADGSYDAKQVSWSIAPVKLVASYAGESVAWGAAPALAVNVTGFVDGETAATASGYKAPVLSAPASPVQGGSYELVPSGGTADNYVFEYVGGTLGYGFEEKPAKALSDAKVTLSFDSCVYDGSAKTPEVSVVYDGLELTEGVDYRVAYDSGRILPGVYYVTVTGEGDYQGAVIRAFAISKRQIAVPEAVPGLVYSGASQVGVKSGGGYVLSGTVSAKHAGFYVATAALSEGYVWSDGSSEAKSVSWSISPAKLTASYAGESVAWDEVPKLAVEVVGFVGGETEDTASGYAAPIASIPVAALEPCTNYVLAPAGGQADDYVFEYVSGMLKVGSKETAVSMESAVVVLSGASYVYDGKAKTPSVVVVLGGKALVEGVDYRLIWDKGRKLPGAYGVTAIGMGSYEGSATASFKIVDAKLAASNVALSYSTTSYNGYVKKPTASVKVGGVYQAKANYTLTYWNKSKTKKVSPKLVGTYYVKVTPKAAANATGSVWKKLTVNPKATANLKLTKLNNGFKASWTKRTAQCSGYQVAYKQVGKSSWNVKTIKGYKTNYKSVSGLKDKKSYYVKVRTYKTVGGVKYYSAWTSTKTVKTR